MNPDLLYPSSCNRGFPQLGEKEARTCAPMLQGQDVWNQPAEWSSCMQATHSGSNTSQPQSKALHLASLVSEVTENADDASKTVHWEGWNFNWEGTCHVELSHVDSSGFWTKILHSSRLFLSSFAASCLLVGLRWNEGNCTCFWQRFSEGKEGATTFCASLVIKHIKTAFWRSPVILLCLDLFPTTALKEKIQKLLVASRGEEAKFIVRMLQVWTLIFPALPGLHLWHHFGVLSSQRNWTILDGLEDHLNLRYTHLFCWSTIMYGIIFDMKTQNQH